MTLAIHIVAQIVIVALVEFERPANRPCHKGAGFPLSRHASSVMQIGDSQLMISDAGIRSPMGAFLYVYVVDTDLVYRRVAVLCALVIAARRSRDTSYVRPKRICWEM